MRQPTFFIPHGGGPCFFMEWTLGPRDSWDRTAEWLRSLEGSLPEPPRALLVVSAHWEQPVPSLVSAGRPGLLYDYSGFPPHTYELTWPAPGDPALAERVRALLAGAGIEARLDAERRWDHGVFIPLKVAFPDARIPTVQLSLVEGLDPATHLALGEALAPLRDEGVVILGSGLSYHNLRSFLSSRGGDDSQQFDAWIERTAGAAPDRRRQALLSWNEAPRARAAHPREEHLLPLLVAAGAAGDDSGAVVFRDQVLGATLSAVRFG